MIASRATVLGGTLLFATALVAAGIAGGSYRGSGPVFGLFTLTFFALGLLAFPRPRLYGYTFLAAFLFLGFWMKVTFHAIWAPGFVEPVGGFSNAPDEWDSALMVAACGAAGLILVRFLHLWLIRPESGTPMFPAWFARWRMPLWLVTIFLIIAVNGANFFFAFYQVGVRPKLLLPLRGHVILAWLVNIGFALWVAALVWWDFRRDGSLGRRLVAPVFESLLSGTSAFSRLNFLLHSAPYLLAVVDRRGELLAGARRRALYKVLAAFVVLFVISVVAVFALRVYVYYGYAAGTASEPFVGHLTRTMVKQVPLLLVHRWVGLEGVLAVGSAPERSPRLLAAAVRESPKLAGQSLFQRTARTHYLSEAPDQFVFLGNAGAIAVLWFSGSLALVFAGMVVIGGILITTEVVADRATGNPFLLAVAGAALANVLAQTTFFYLTLVFLLQLWIGIGFIAVLQRLGSDKSRKG